MVDASAARIAGRIWSSTGWTAPGTDARSAEARANEDEVADDLDLLRVDGDLAEEPEARHHQEDRDRADEAVAVEARDDLPGDEARADEADHHRGDEQAGVRRGDPEDALVD